MSDDRHKLVKRAERELARHNREVGKIADARLAEMAWEFAKRYPKRKLRIIFGNGADYVEIDGDDLGWFRVAGDDEQHITWRDMDVSKQLAFMYWAMSDIDTITDGYGNGCPNDVEVEGGTVRIG